MEIVKHEVVNGEFLLYIKENDIIKEIELNEADEKYGEEIIDFMWFNYMEK